MIKRLPRNAALGALMDEYEKALNDLKAAILSVNESELVTVVDTETKDENCISIQSILTHIISSGYYYTVIIRNHLGEKEVLPSKKKLKNIDAYLDEINKMFDYNLFIYDLYLNTNITENDNEKKIITNWGQCYDIEQLLEHAIVHVLRHRRQIKQYIVKIRTPNW